MIKHISKREKGFVQMPNSILSNPNISFKAKTVFAIMLSLPESWNFNIEGISNKCKESRDCIAKAIQELIAAGYVKRTRTRGADGRIIKWNYEIFEEPYIVSESDTHDQKRCDEKSSDDNPEFKKPELEKPVPDNSSKEIPSEENHRINNIKTNNKENSNTICNNTQSNHISSKHKTSCNMSEMKSYLSIVEKNIDYSTLLERNPRQQAMLKEIVELMVETLCSKRESITIASDIYPAEYVKETFLSITSEHIGYILECMSKHTTKISNIKQYLLSVIFNAVKTIDCYYTVTANHDLYG